MALVVRDRVQETTTTTGTGTITLAGAVSGFQSFSVIGDSNTTFYSIVGGTEWELGIGTYTSSGTTLSRDTILESSNGGTAVNFSAGTKTVFCTYPAERSVYVDGSSIVPGATATLPISSGGTGSSTAAFSGANITGLNATAITAGTISNNRTTASSSNGASTIVERDATGNFTANVITANGSSITSINAANISSGTLGVARGGTGAATLTANNVILGNGTSSVLFVAPGTSSNVLTSNGSTWASAAIPAATIPSTYDAVGSYALLHNTSTTTTYSAGDTAAGSDIRVTGAIRSTIAQTVSTGAAPSGTWRIMSLYNNNIANKSLLVGLWIRIS